MKYKNFIILSLFAFSSAYAGGEHLDKILQNALPHLTKLQSQFDEATPARKQRVVEIMAKTLVDSDESVPASEKKQIIEDLTQWLLAEFTKPVTVPTCTPKNEFTPIQKQVELLKYMVRSGILPIDTVKKVAQEQGLLPPTQIVSDELDEAEKAELKEIREAYYKNLREGETKRLKKMLAQIAVQASLASIPYGVSAASKYFTSSQPSLPHHKIMPSEGRRYLNEISEIAAGPLSTYAAWKVNEAVFGNPTLDRFHDLRIKLDYYTRKGWFKGPEIDLIKSQLDGIEQIVFTPSRQNENLVENQLKTIENYFSIPRHTYPINSHIAAERLEIALKGTPEKIREPLKKLVGDIIQQSQLPDSPAINQKIVALFLGVPGSGKTRMAKLISWITQRPLIILNLKDPTGSELITGPTQTKPGGLLARGLMTARYQEVDQFGKPVMKDEKPIFGKLDKGPIFLLDEADKPANDPQGAPLVALLLQIFEGKTKTILDTSLGIEIPVDRAIFLSTANDQFKNPAFGAGRFQHVIHFDEVTESARRAVAQSTVEEYQKLLKISIDTQKQAMVEKIIQEDLRRKNTDVRKLVNVVGSYFLELGKAGNGTKTPIHPMFRSKEEFSPKAAFDAQDQKDQQKEKEQEAEAAANMPPRPGFPPGMMGMGMPQGHGGRSGLSFPGARPPYGM